MIAWVKEKYAEMSMKYPAHAKIARFLISGGTAAGTNLGLLFVLTHFFHVWYLLSSVLAFLIAFFVSFTLQKFWTFGDASKENMKSQAIVYFCTVLIGLGVNTTFVYLLVERAGLHYLLANIIGNGLVAIGNFFAYKEFIFKKPEERAGLNGGRTFLILFLIFIAFLIPRIAGLDLPYHQDEWKNVAASATVAGAGEFFTHPPFMQMVFVAGYAIVGADHMRMIPLAFSVAAFFLLFLVVKRRVSSTAGLWSVFLFALCFYNILGSLQPDVDGSVLPFLFLLAVYCYDRFAEAANKKWLALTIAVCLIGFLFKLSFIIVVGALLVDYLFAQWGKVSAAKLIGKLAAFLGGFILIYAALLYIIQALYPAFNIHTMFGHADAYGATLGRNWMQIIVQASKAVYYLSPLLLVPILFISKDIFKKTRIFSLYLIFGAIFYFGIFDFSRGALDKYLMFDIVPLAVIIGSIAAHIFGGASVFKMKWPLVIGLVLSVVLKLTNFLPQTVAALYPKTEWFSRVAHLHWDILTPLTGGSGPLGLYVSFMFIALSFIVSLAIGVVAFFKREWRSHAFIILVMIGVAYNGIFAEELLWGKINGSAPAVVASSVAFLEKTPAITQVLTYNDSGAGSLTTIGKYAGRFYATPDFEAGHRVKFAAFDGEYLVIDIPHLYESGFYGKFFASCASLFATSSGKITGTVYDCSKSKKLINSL